MLSKELINGIGVKFNILGLNAGRLHSLHPLAHSDELVDLVLVLAESLHDIAILCVLGSSLLYFTLNREGGRGGSEMVPF